MEFLRKVGSYLILRRQVGHDGQRPAFNVRAMHTVNKLSILMFLLAMVLLALKVWV